MRNMELQRWIEMGFQISKAYIFLTLNEVALAVFLVLVESLASSGISTLIIVVYEHVLATIVLSLLSFFFEKYVFYSLSSQYPFFFLFFLFFLLLGGLFFLTSIYFVLHHCNILTRT